jgi:hypothetical protein
MRQRAPPCVHAGVFAPSVGQTQKYQRQLLFLVARRARVNLASSPATLLASPGRQL